MQIPLGSFVESYEPSPFSILDPLFEEGIHFGYKSRDGNGAGRGRISLSHTHSIKKIHPYTQTQRLSNLCLIPISTE